jgi:hypothetical protein
MAARRAGREHDGIRFKEVDMQTRLSFWAAALAARLPQGLADALLRCRPLVRGRRPVLARLDLPLPMEDSGGWGCGWFDSSHELVHGLQVEEDSAEAVSALPLVVWLDLEWRSAGLAAPSA